MQTVCRRKHHIVITDKACCNSQGNVEFSAYYSSLFIGSPSDKLLIARRSFITGHRAVSTERSEPTDQPQQLSGSKLHGFVP